MKTGFRLLMDDALKHWRKARRGVLRSHAGSSEVHRWRICTRRLCALEELLTPDRKRSLRLHKALHKAFHASGKLRDTQLAIRQLKSLGARFSSATALARHLRSDISRQRHRATRRLHAVNTHRLRKIATMWLPQAGRDFERAARARAVRRMARADTRLHLTRARTPASIHRWRLRLKSLRYGQELCLAAGLRLAHSRTPRRLARQQAMFGEVTDLQTLLDIIERHGRRHPHWRADSDSKALRKYLSRLRGQRLHAVLRLNLSV